jgi:hypothetical protein
LRHKLVHDLESASKPANYDPYHPPEERVEKKVAVSRDLEITWVNQPQPRRQERLPARMQLHQDSGKVVGAAVGKTEPWDCWSLFFDKICNIIIHNTNNRITAFKDSGRRNDKIKELDRHGLEFRASIEQANESSELQTMTIKFLDFILSLTRIIECFDSSICVMKYMV